MLNKDMGKKNRRNNILSSNQGYKTLYGSSTTLRKTNIAKK